MLSSLITHTLTSLTNDASPVCSGGAPTEIITDNTTGFSAISGSVNQDASATFTHPDLTVVACAGITGQDASATYFASFSQGSTATSLPGWLSYDDSTRTITANPTAAEVGSHTIYITATSGGTPLIYDTEHSFTITVNAVNYAPVLTNGPLAITCQALSTCT